MTIQAPETVGPEYLAKALRLHRVTVLRMVREGRIPKPLPVGGGKLKRWNKRAIDAWLGETGE